MHKDLRSYDTVSLDEKLFGRCELVHRTSRKAEATKEGLRAFFADAVIDLQMSAVSKPVFVLRMWNAPPGTWLFAHTAWPSDAANASKRPPHMR